MPLREYKCVACKTEFEAYDASTHVIHVTRPCPVCDNDADLVEVSRPAKRDPAHGIQR